VPRLLDADRRRADLAAAVWRIVARNGVAAASVRTVAREAGLSAGSVRHVFPSQDELLHFAMAEVVARSAERIRAGAVLRVAQAGRGEVVAAVRALLEELLPLDDERMVEARVCQAFVASGASDPATAALRAQVDAGLRGVCGHCVDALAEHGRLGAGRDREVETGRLWAVVDGLALHVLADPATTAAGVRGVLDVHLADLGRRAAR
jgi:AcrR family transcriptional regulator